MLVALEPTFGGINLEDIKVSWQGFKGRQAALAAAATWCHMSR